MGEQAVNVKDINLETPSESLKTLFLNKTTTDYKKVWLLSNKPFSQYAWRQNDPVHNSLLTCIDCSLKEKPHLGCPSSTWATQSWEVEFWDLHTPWPTQESSYSCKSLVTDDDRALKQKTQCLQIRSTRRILI